MGCGQSSVSSGVGDTKKNTTTLGVEKVKKEAERRRSASGMLENLVHEEFDKGWTAFIECAFSSDLCMYTLLDISEIYEVNNTHILGEGISGQVRVCKHKQVT